MTETLALFFSFIMGCGIGAMILLMYIMWDQLISPSTNRR